MIKVKYELQFKTVGCRWKVFDTYSSKGDEDLRKYANALSVMKFNDGVRLIKVETSREEVEIND